MLTSTKSIISRDFLDFGRTKPIELCPVDHDYPCCVRYLGSYSFFVSVPTLSAAGTALALLIDTAFEPI